MVNPRLGLIMLILAGTACRSTAERCDPGEETALDYADTRSWVCHPGRDDDACRAAHDGKEVLPDGGLVPLVHDVAANAAADCFYVYPTVDLGLIPGVHDDFSETDEQERTAHTQASRLLAACRVFAPLYRQVTLGTYGVANRERVQKCFDTAYLDVRRAFDAFLASIPADRTIVMVGHSQGAQITARLVKERVDSDPVLRARVAGVLPIGWPIGTRNDDVVGGTSSTVPICTRDDQADCMIGFRSFAAGNDLPEENDRFREGDRSVCVHPGSVADGGPRLLVGAFLSARLRGVVTPPDGVEPGSDTDLLYRDFFSARCVEKDGHHALEVSASPRSGDVRANPVDFDHALLDGFNGTHILDVQFTMMDLVERVKLMVANHRP